MKSVVLTPNPYRDKNFHTVREAMRILRECGVQTRLCLPFEVDKSFELPRDLRFSRLDRELPNADMVICFGGDGTILHMAKAATRRGIPILGVNIGTMGFIAELESSELDKLKRLAAGDYTLDRRMMLDVTVQRDRDIMFHDICLNDVAITKGTVARIVHLGIKCDVSPPCSAAETAWYWLRLQDQLHTACRQVARWWSRMPTALLLPPFAPMPWPAAVWWYLTAGWSLWKWSATPAAMPFFPWTAARHCA